MATDYDINRTPAARGRIAKLARLGQPKQRGRIPYIQQLTATECGAACLAMVLGYHGKSVPVSEIREVSGVGRDGTTAKAIVQTGRWYGLRARGVAMDIGQLEHLPPASILHWGFHHFVVFERLRKDGVSIVDPGSGRRLVPMDEFRREFTGVALLFEPGERFEPHAQGSSRIWRYIRQGLAYTGYLPKIVIISLLLQLFALGVPLLTGALVDRVVPHSDRHLLMVLVIGLSALVLFQFFASMIRAHLLLHLRTLFDVRMVLDFLEHLVNLPYAFFQRRSTGDLMARVGSNSTIREIFTSSALSGLLDGTLVILYLGVILWASPAMCLLVLVLALMQATVVWLARRRQRELLAQNLQIQARADSYLVELLSGIESLKVMGCEQRAVDHWTELFIDVLNIAIERGRLGALVGSILSSLWIASPLCVLSYGAVLVLNGELSLGSMLALNALAAGFFGPLSNLIATVSQLQLVVSYMQRIEDVLEAEPEQDPTQVHAPPPLQGRIELEHVSFRYSPLAPLVLEDVSLTIQPGELVAIVGRSGSGKSTLASLLVGLHKPISGRILYDGLDMAQLELKALRRQVGMVPQHPFLFAGSIRSNIAMADPELPLERMVEAAKVACIHEDFDAMPMRYDTVLIDRGASLSGGQRQRLALARALVTNPAVLVLDEATSALDTVTEARVQASLASLRCTRVVVAHRLSTVVHADRILVMDQGHLVEQGTHAELLARGGIYAALAAAQLGSGGAAAGS